MFQVNGWHLSKRILNIRTPGNLVVGCVFTTLPHDHETHRRCKDGPDEYENTMFTRFNAKNKKSTGGGRSFPSMQSCSTPHTPWTSAT